MRKKGSCQKQELAPIYSTCWTQNVEHAIGRDPNRFLQFGGRTLVFAEQIFLDCQHTDTEASTQI